MRTMLVMILISTFLVTAHWNHNYGIKVNAGDGVRLERVEAHKTGDIITLDIDWSDTSEKSEKNE